VARIGEPPRNFVLNGRPRGVIAELPGDHHMRAFCHEEFTPPPDAELIAIRTVSPVRIP
jgi:hypothetical protein